MACLGIGVMTITIRKIEMYEKAIEKWQNLTRFAIASTLVVLLTTDTIMHANGLLICLRRSG